MQRIQCKRTRGWRKPAGAVYVGRGPNSKWGNPYKVNIYDREQAVALFRQDVERMPAAARETWLAPLRKATALMCWCKPDELCHADVLIEYLSRPTTSMPTASQMSGPVTGVNPLLIGVDATNEETNLTGDHVAPRE